MPVEDRQKWDTIHGDRGFSPSSPSSLILANEDFLPREGKALDVAGGTGRHALWLAERGMQVALADISPIALKIAEDEARRRKLLLLSTLCIDLELDPFPRGPFNAILCVHYLHRPLFADFASTLSKEGVLLFVQPTRSNLERHSRPSERYLLEDGELEALARDQGLEILHHEEGWLAEGRHEAVLVARRGPGR